MKFNFFTQNAACNNSAEARLRESTRMCAIAYGLAALGHETVIVDAPDQLKSSPRWRHFEPLHGPRNSGYRVHPAEMMVGDIGIKCSIGTARDKEMLSRLGIVVAHEYGDEFSTHRKLLKVPFLIHDTVMSGLVEMGLFGAYLGNEIEQIREAFQWQPTKMLGFCGCGWRHRKEAMHNEPEWADIRFYDTQVMSGVEHAKWLCQFRGGLCMPGDTPKSNLPPLLAMLGVPIVMWPIARVDTPPISDYNAVMFESWEQVKAELEDGFRLAGVREHATETYIDSWSPMGQSRLIAEFFE